MTGQRLATTLPGSAAQVDPRELTPRQREVLAWIGRGASNAEIAGRLCISGNTVQHHLSAIYAKLGCSNRLQAALHAMRRVS